MKINAIDTFLHGRTRYEAGTEYDVLDDEGAYFVAQGWAEGPEGFEADVHMAVPEPYDADASEAARARGQSLDIQDSTLGAEGGL